MEVVSKLRYAIEQRLYFMARLLKVSRCRFSEIGSYPEVLTDFSFQALSKHQAIERLECLLAEPRAS